MPVWDVAAVAAQLVCSDLTLLALFYSEIATWLSQINQLIVLGFMLGLENPIFNGMAMKASIVAAASQRSTAIQDLDALMRKDFWDSRAHVFVRVFLFLLDAMPLALAVGYKTFAGGYTTKTLQLGDGAFGFTASPGKQRVGNDVSICTDIYLNFWTEPKINQTYGYALYVPDNETAVVVDAPLPEYVQVL